MKQGELAVSMGVARVECTTRLFRPIAITWLVALLIVNLLIFPKFVFEWHRGAPLALSAGVMAFLWASCALWAGGFRIGNPRIGRQTIMRAQEPGIFWRYVIVALAAGVALVWLGATRLGAL